MILDLADAGQIDAALAAELLDYVGNVQAALDEGETETAKEILEDLIDESDSEESRGRARHL